MFEFDAKKPELMAQPYRDYQKRREYTTNDILLENRIIFFGAAGNQVYYPEINDQTACMCCRNLLPAVVKVVPYVAQSSQQNRSVPVSNR